MGGISPEQAELELLIELAAGAKDFEQVYTDGRRHGCTELIRDTNASRGIHRRLRELTGISKESLSWFPVRCDPDSDIEDGDSGVVLHPFVLISTMVEKLLEKDPSFFEVHLEPLDPDVVASSFVLSPEYLLHEHVQDCAQRGETVVPVSLYSDGMKVCCDQHPDSLYAIYVNFIHRDSDECTRKESKHVLTVYRKSEINEHTLADMWKVILWDLEALAKGCKPRVGEEEKLLSDQVPGESLGGAWGLTHKICLMQIRGDWAWFVEALGAWQWNCKCHMCPFCGAQRDGLYTWKNFALDAPWRCTIRTHAQFLLDLELSRRHRFRRGQSPLAFEPLISRAPFFSWTMIKVDWMHAMDLGVLVYMLGEVWWSLLARLGVHAGGSLSKRRRAGCKVLKKRLRQYYKTHRISSKLPLKRFKITKIKSGKAGPKLKAKASQARKLLPFTMQLVGEFREQGDAMGEHRYQCVLHLCQLYDLSNRRALTAADITNWRWLTAMFMSA